MVEKTEYWYIFFRNVCLVMQWFNPLVWYAARCSVEDCELACDYQVLRSEDKEAQVIYGRCLLAMAAKNPNNFLQSVKEGTSLSKGSLKRRLRYISNGAPSTVLAVALISVMLFLTGSLFVGHQNGKETILYQLAQLPGVREKVYCYELTEPSEENMECVLQNIMIRRDATEKNIKVFQIDESMIGIVFPLGKELLLMSNEEMAEHLANGTSLTVVTETKQMVIDVQEEMLLQEQGENGNYALWVKISDGEIDLSIDCEYKVYIGEQFLYSGEHGDVRDSYICLAKECSFDVMYDMIQLILADNPCELVRR